MMAQLNRRLSQASIHNKNHANVLWLTMIYCFFVDSGILRFTVHECRNLGSSRVSPYVRVLINGTERITTPVFKRNPNPKFERPGEVVVLDQTAVYIRVEVRDSISFAEDPVIGLWRSYLSDMMQEMEENDGWWNLIMEDGTKLLGRIRLSMQWKPVVMTGLSEAMGGHGLYSEYKNEKMQRYSSDTDIRCRSTCGRRQTRMLGSQGSP